MRALFQQENSDVEVSPVFSAPPSALSRPAWAAPAELSERAPAAPLPAGAASDPLADAVAKARAEGIAEGRAAAARETESTREKLQAALADAVGLREKVLAQSEEDLVRLALLVAETLVGGTDASRETFTRTMLKSSLDLMKQADTVTLRVHPSERPLIESAIQEAGPSTRVLEDASIGRGGLVVESELGRVDATLKRALADVARGLGLQVGEASGGRRSGDVRAEDA